MMKKRVHIRFNKGIDEALVWMWERRRDELNAFDSRRRLTFNEFLNDVVGDWLENNKLELSEELGVLRDEWIKKVVDESEEKGKEEEDW